MKNIIIITLILLCFVTRGQTISTFAGGGANVNVNGVPATSTQLFDPCGGTFDKLGNYYFAEALGGHIVKKIDPYGIITTVAGIGVSGFSGDGGPATAAMLHGPTCVVLDGTGNVYISDASNFRIRKIDAATGIINTIAGNGIGGYSGDGGPSTAASISNAPGIFVDKHGNLFIADFGNARVRKVNTSGIISNFAGNGAISGYSGDGSRADTAKIGGISDVYVDVADNVYLSANSNSSVYKVNASGVITTVAGSGIGYIFNGDEIPAITANIDPQRITMDKFGNLYIAELHNYRVRRVATNGIIYTIAGIGTAGFSGDGGPATAAQLSYPVGVALDSCNNLYISEANNNRVRKVTYSKCNYLENKNVITNDEIFLYSNPVTNELHVDNVKTVGNYVLLSITETIQRQGLLKAGNNTISVQSLPLGIYILELIDNEGNKMVKKIIKQ